MYKISARRILCVPVIVVALFALSACVTVRGVVRPGSSRVELRHTIDSLTSQVQFRNANWGVLIVNPRTGDTIYSKNAGKLFMPASNMKIITSAAALTLLGPDYTYKTTFLADGPVRDSLLDGNLLVIGRGDPTISDNMRGVATTIMDALADSVRAHGIRQVTATPGKYHLSVYWAGFGSETLDDMSVGGNQLVDVRCQLFRLQP